MLTDSCRAGNVESSMIRKAEIERILIMQRFRMGKILIYNKGIYNKGKKTNKRNRSVSE